MDDFMDLKQKALKANMQTVSGLSMVAQKILNIELKEINQHLFDKFHEASRRFGVFFMELFQVLMEATKKMSPSVRRRICP